MRRRSRARSFAKSAIRVKRLAIGSQSAGYRLHYSVDILIRRLPVADTDAHGAVAAPGCAAKKCYAGLLVRRHDFISAAVVQLLRLRLIQKKRQAGMRATLTNGRRERQECLSYSVPIQETYEALINDGWQPFQGCVFYLTGHLLTPGLPRLNPGLEFANAFSVLTFFKLQGGCADSRYRRVVAPRNASYIHG
jgi:hypothetical protein